MTSTDVTRYDQPDMVNTIRQTVAKGATDAQLQMFLAVCKRTGLDPFLKEIWYVPDRGTIMAGRDGYLRVANEHPMFDGMETRVERDSNNIPIKAICSVYRKDRSHPITCEAYYSEYKKASPVWNQYPSAMISKVAEVLALKRSFSINGVVTEEEIGDGEPRGSKAAQKEVLERELREIEDRKVLKTEAAEVLPGEPYYEEIPEARADVAEPGLKPPHDEQLRDSIAAIPVKKLTPKKRTAKQIAVLQEFGPLHDRYKVIGMEPRYYEQLGAYGVCKSTEFNADTEDGYAQAMRCCKEMKIDVAEMEEFVRKQKEIHA